MDLFRTITSLSVVKSKVEIFKARHIFVFVILFSVYYMDYLYSTDTEDICWWLITGNSELVFVGGQTERALCGLWS